MQAAATNCVQVIYLLGAREAGQGYQTCHSSMRCRTQSDPNKRGCFLREADPPDVTLLAMILADLAS